MVTKFHSGCIATGTVLEEVMESFGKALTCLVEERQEDILSHALHLSIIGLMRYFVAFCVVLVLW